MKTRTANLVAYCYGESADEIELQVKLVESFAIHVGSEIKIWREVRRPGKLPGPAFEHALAVARSTRGMLIFSTLGDIARQAEPLSALIGVAFRVIDDPVLSPAALPIMIRTAQEHVERSARVKTALARKRDSLNALSVAEREQVVRSGGRLKLGGRLIDDAGRQSSSEVRRKAADARAKIVEEEVQKLLDAGVLETAEIARKLNENGVKRPRGGDWTGKYVSAVTLRLRRSQ